ncbi:MAG TPA: response regulator transcription factor [Verrucomicrobiae bacterium]|jgi:DNA-binding NarL/FixJ family response regulator|nr:response regulator transcription factor [Verrucomicrobiae bacterium]
MNEKKVRVLLADDHELVRAGVRKVLENSPGFEVVGEASRGDETLAKLAELEPDVLLLDLNMPGGDGFEVLRTARDTAGGTRIVVLSLHVQAEYVSRAVREGADGYLSKDLAAQELPDAIASVMAGKPWYSAAVQEVLAKVVRTGGTRPLEKLTPREREVLVGIARGLTSKEIGAHFNISARTVETHRAALMRKLDVRSIALLTQLAIREGLVEGPV